MLSLPLLEPCSNSILLLFKKKLISLYLSSNSDQIIYKNVPSKPSLNTVPTLKYNCVTKFSLNYFEISGLRFGEDDYLNAKDYSIGALFTSTE